jgi:chorismate-pyruvate lyase
MTAAASGPDLPTLFALFPPADPLPEYELVPADEVPPPYRELLVHEHHMTVTVEAHHGDLVDVRVLDRRLDGDSYARKIVLTLRKSGKVVLFGIPRIHLRYCSAEVRAAILAEQTPLGRILIEHDVLRRIEPTAYLRVIPSAAMMRWFGLDRPRPTYGRLAIIHCDEQPAIELLEIVAPEWTR